MSGLEKEGTSPLKYHRKNIRGKENETLGGLCKISVEEEAKVIFIWGRLCLSSAMRRLFHLVLILLLSAPLRDDNSVDVRILRGYHRHCCSDLGHLFYTTLLLLLYLFLIRAKGILFWGEGEAKRH